MSWAQVSTLDCAQGAAMAKGRVGQAVYDGVVYGSVVYGSVVFYGSRVCGSVVNGRVVVYG